MMFCICKCGELTYCVGIYLTQVSSFWIGQRYNIYIHGRRFLTLNSSKVLGLEKFGTALLTLLKNKPSAHFIVIFMIMIFFLQEDDKIIDLVSKYGPTKWSHCKGLQKDPPTSVLVISPLPRLIPSRSCPELYCVWMSAPLAWSGC